MGAWTNVGSVAVLVGLGWIAARTPEGPGVEGPLPQGDPREPAPSGQLWTFAREPKPLTSTAERGLDWLVGRQLQSGGWGQGEESEHMGHALDHLIATADVADTCMAALALLRSGAAPGEGARGAALARGIDFVCAEVEESDADSLYVTAVRGTRVQSKIGTYVDTFLASMLLTEAKGRMGSEDANARVEGALAKVLAKIQRNQQADGGFAGTGWAPVLAQSMAGKALNRAAQVGAPVAAEVNARNNLYFLDYAADGGAGGAGIPLYSLSAKLGALRDFVSTNAQRERELEEVLAVEVDETVRQKAGEELEAIGRALLGCEQVERDVLERLADPAFVSGFGTNGGEEFLSYMNLSESLVVKGGEAWERWDRGLAQNLARVQNADGSWTGHHCITGRTFVTAAALLSLLADRAPIPVAAVEAQAQ